MEGGQALLDGLFVVIHAARGLGAVQEAFHHDLVRHLKVQYFRAGKDLREYAQILMCSFGGFSN